MTEKVNSRADRMTSSHRESLWALAGVIFLDALSYSLILPLLPFILKSFHAGAITGGFLIAIHSLFSAVSGPILGAASDRLGRRTIILVSIVGTCASYLVFSFSQNLVTLFLARAIAGAMAGNVGVVQAAAADGAPEGGRAKTMSVLSAAMAMGFVLGPVLSAVIGQVAPESSLWAGVMASLASVVSLATAWRFYREEPQAPSMAPSARGARLFSKAMSGGTRELIGVAAASAMAQTGMVAMTGFWAHHAFGWGVREVGFLFFWTASCMVAAQIVAVPKLVKALGESAALKAAVALCVLAVAGLIFGAHSRVALLMCSPGLFCGITIIQTMAASLLSQQVGAAERGALLGLSNGVSSVARVIGPALCGLVFVRLDPTAPFWLIGVVMGACLIWFPLRRQRVRIHPL